MDEGAKRRLVGAAVLVALAVIFVPMLLDDKQTDGLGDPIVIPDEPAFEAGSDDSVAVDGDQAPALPSPEAPSPVAPSHEVNRGASDSGLDAADRAAPLPAPTPPQQGPVPGSPPTQTRARAQPVPDPAPARSAEPAVAGPKPIPAGVAAWVVQVASLGSSSAATSLQNELRVKGYAAFVEQATVNGKRYYRVRVGPETDRDWADRIAARLQRETGNQPLVQTYR